MRARLLAAGADEIGDYVAEELRQMSSEVSTESALAVALAMVRGASRAARSIRPGTDGEIMKAAGLGTGDLA